MYRYLLVVLVAVALVGCGETESMKERARAERINAEAVRVAAEAEREAAIAEQVRHVEESKRFDILADAAKPVYWPIGLLVVAIVVIVYMNHRAQLAAVAMLTGQRSETVRLLPGSVEFERALLEYARDTGREVKRGRQTGAYYLIDAEGGREKVKSLTAT